MSNAKIYADAYQLSILIFERTRSFPKFHRPTLGRRLEEASLDLAVFIRYALMAPKHDQKRRRLAHLDAAGESLDELRIVCQLCRDLDILPAAPYKDFCELTDEVGRELGGLRKFELRSTPSA